MYVYDLHSKFQSTLPMKGATVAIAADTLDTSGFQSTLPMKGATAGFAL